MATSQDTRYHEAAHAVTALKLGIGLKEEGMILNSDEDAWVEVADIPEDGADENWFIRRVAVKLAGPVASIQQRGEVLEWDTLKYRAEFHDDFECSLCLLDTFWERVGTSACSDQIENQMQRAACIATECVNDNKVLILEITKAAADKDRFSRSEILAIMNACSPV